MTGASALTLNEVVIFLLKLMWILAMMNLTTAKKLWKLATNLAQTLMNLAMPMWNLTKMPWTKFREWRERRRTNRVFPLRRVRRVRLFERVARRVGNDAIGNPVIN